MADIKVRAWQEQALPQRVINTGDGLVVVNRGDFAMIITAKSWSELAQVLAILDPKLTAPEE